MSKPYLKRYEMAYMWISESADIITFSCAVAILRYDESELTSSYLDKVGTCMIIVQSISLSIHVLDSFIFGVDLIFNAKDTYNFYRTPKFVRIVKMAVDKEFRKSEIKLQKKYFDKWMVIALKKGLNGRKVSRIELPWRYVVKCFFVEHLNNLKWFINEMIEILFRDVWRKFWRGFYCCQKHSD